MQVAILAGGLATRLRPLTENLPKSMVRIRGKPFLEYQLELLRRNGVRDIVLCIGYLGEQIEDYFGDGSRLGISIKYSREKEKLLGTAGALKNARSLLKNEFFMMNGDSYLFLSFADVMSYFRKFNKLGLMVVYKNYDRYETSNVVIEDNRVKQYSKRGKTEDMVYIDYGASILRKEALKLIPPKQVYSQEEFLAELIKQEELLAFEVKERFYQIGSPEGLKEFKKYIMQTSGVM